MASPSEGTDLEQLKLTLQRSPLLRALLEVSPKAVMSALKHETVKAGTVLFRQGEPGERVYAIWSGRLRVQHDVGVDQPIVLRDVFPGDVVGEIALLDNQPRSASVVVVDDSRLVSLSREHFQQLVNRPEVTLSLLAALSHRLRSSSDYLVATTRLTQHLSGEEIKSPSEREGWQRLSALHSDLHDSIHTTQDGIGSLQARIAAAGLEDIRIESIVSLLNVQMNHTLRLLDEIDEALRLLSEPSQMPPS